MLNPTRNAKSLINFLSHKLDVISPRQFFITLPKYVKVVYLFKTQSLTVTAVSRTRVPSKLLRFLTSILLLSENTWQNLSGELVAGRHYLFRMLSSNFL